MSKTKEVEKQQQRVFIISEQTQKEIMKFLDQCAYGTVKHLVTGMNAGKFVPVQVVDAEKELPSNGKSGKTKKKKEPT